jgi:hypothetical protein
MIISSEPTKPDALCECGASTHHIPYEAWLRGDVHRNELYNDTAFGNAHPEAAELDLYIRRPDCSYLEETELVYARGDGYILVLDTHKKVEREAA